MYFRNLLPSLLGILFSAFLTSGAFAAPQALSPLRHPQEPYSEASARARLQSGADTILLSEHAVVEDVQKPLGEIDIQSIPELSSLEELKAQFAFVRDTPFLKRRSLKFPRRLTWLYPDDGCYARAELAAQFLKEAQVKSPKKLFVFGELSAETKNTASGTISWWYHVAVTYRVGTTAYVFDPALNPMEPMTLKDWNKAVDSGRSAVNYALCSTAALDPSSYCDEGQPLSRQMAIEIQVPFLSEEWHRLEELHRDPEAELGANPPWKN